MCSALALCDSSARGFHVQPRKLWLVCTGTTDNSFMARKVVSKTGTENCTVYFESRMINCMKCSIRAKM